MINARRRTTATVAIMIVLAIAIVLFYCYLSNRTHPLFTSDNKKLSEVEKLTKKDLTQYYPETPREVVKLYASMVKAMYNNPDDDKINELALKVRSLYDKEFLDKNPESTYLANLSADLAKWKKEKQKITNYLMVNKEGNEENQVNGEKYVTQYVSFTIQKNGKFTDIWKVLLRQDSNKHWKILGWKSVTENNNGK